MKSVKIGIIGLGTVGSQVYEILESNKDYFKNKSGVAVQIDKICDKYPQNISAGIRNNSKFVEDVNLILDDEDIDIVVELVGGTTTAKDYTLKALNNGKHVVTANKALLAEELDLFNIASGKNKLIKFEASVGGSIPVIRTIQQSLIADTILNLYGIVNGTSNYILSRMEKEKCDFEKALKQAQKKGYAEQNPKLDIEGIDSVHKLIILAYLCFGIILKPDDILCEGISNIEFNDIQYAKESGYKIRLLAIAKKGDNKLDLRVHPTLISENHLLSSVRGVYNAIYIESVLAGKTFLFGRGAGGRPTASAVVSDIIDISSKIISNNKDVEGRTFDLDKNLTVKNINDIYTRYYIRFMAIDKTGVLAKISNILGKHKISISSVIQKERSKSKVVPIVMMTHKARESHLQEAICKIKKLDIVKDDPVVIRVEGGDK